MPDCDRCASQGRLRGSSSSSQTANHVPAELLRFLREKELAGLHEECRAPNPRSRSQSHSRKHRVLMSLS